MTKNKTNGNRAVKTVPRTHGNEAQSEQMSLFNNFQTSGTVLKTLTKKQVQECYGISESELSKCQVREFLEFDNLVILHTGRNCWRVLKN